MKVGEILNMFGSHSHDWEVTDQAGKALSLKATAHQHETTKAFSVRVEVEAAASPAPAIESAPASKSK